MMEDRQISEKEWMHIYHDCWILAHNCAHDLVHGVETKDGRKRWEQYLIEVSDVKIHIHK